MRIGIDLDGVTYDFVGALREYALREGLADDLPPATCWDFFKVDWGWDSATFLDVFGRGVLDGSIFWEGRPIDGAVEALAELRAAGHEIVIVTHREHPDATVNASMRSATVHWLDVHKIPHDSLIFDGTKTRLGLDVMLDDAPHQLEAAAGAGERPIAFTQRWNEHLEDVERVDGWRSFVRLVRDSAVYAIGVSGKAQHGKDTIGRVLLDYDFERASFADALRAILLDLDPLLMPTEGNVDSHGHGYERRGYRYVVPLSEYVAEHGWEEAKRRTDCREYQIRLGMSLRERIDPDVWVNAVRRTLEPGHRYVFTDVRFPNEAEAIRRLGGEVWRVHRPGLDDSSDYSETALDGYDFDVTIMNEHSLESLERTVRFIVDEDRDEDAEARHVEMADPHRVYGGEA